MSQSRVKTFQTLKSLNYLYKVCSGRNGSRSYCSFSSVNVLSFVKKFSTLNSAATDDRYDFQNPNGKSSSGYGEYDWSVRESHSEFKVNPNGVYRENSMGVQTGGYVQSYSSGSLRSGFQTNPDECNKIYQNYGSNRLFEESRNLQSNRVSEEVLGGGDGMFQETQSLNNSQVASYTHLDDKSDARLNATIERLDAFCRDKKLKEAVEVLGLLEQHNVSVDIPRYLFLMNECGEAQALEEARYVHEHLTRSVSHLDVRICNKIMEMYSKCGSMEDAYMVFSKMPQRNLTSWDIMVTWLAKNGHGEDAIEMFTEFKKVGLKPDDQMFFGVFTACSVLGDMKEGLLHFESMSKNYNIVPSMDHYVSVVDMLGSAGYLNEALEFIEKMPMEPSVKVWEVMMNQCRIHGDTEVGDRCAELVELLDPSRLDEQSKAGLIPIKASDIAKEKEKKRLSGSNPLEIKTKVHEYRAGDTSHPEHEKLYSQLRCLKQAMKEVGYVPEVKFVLHDIDHESKEEALLSHSERLALSQALMTSPARAPIRIIKNLRVCGDCHNALKIISKLVGRLIVARDAKRFHHFENGVCSCGDYW